MSLSRSFLRLATGSFIFSICVFFVLAWFGVPTALCSHIPGGRVSPSSSSRMQTLFLKTPPRKREDLVRPQMLSFPNLFRKPPSILHLSNEKYPQTNLTDSGPRFSSGKCKIIFQTVLPSIASYRLWRYTPVLYIYIHTYKSMQIV